MLFFCFYENFVYRNVSGTTGTTDSTQRLPFLRTQSPLRTRESFATDASFTPKMGGTTDSSTQRLSSLRTQESFATDASLTPKMGVDELLSMEKQYQMLMKRPVRPLPQGTACAPVEVASSQPQTLSSGLPASSR